MCPPGAQCGCGGSSFPGPLEVLGGVLSGAAGVVSAAAPAVPVLAVAGAAAVAVAFVVADWPLVLAAVVLTAGGTVGAVLWLRRFVVVGRGRPVARPVPVRRAVTAGPRAIEAPRARVQDAARPVMMDRGR